MRNVITPMGSASGSKPTVREVELPSGKGNVQEAKATRRKAREIHNPVDRAARRYPIRKDADVDVVNHPKVIVMVANRGKS